MADYEEFLECKNALAIRLTSLAKMNIEYLSMPFLSALWAMEIDSMKATGKAIGMFERVIRLLYLSLRLGNDNRNSIKCLVQSENPRILSHIEVEQTDGNPVKITPLDFTTTIRSLIAEINGIELPDESENPDILQTERAMEQESANRIKFDIDTLIASVANASHLRECEIAEWTVAEFERRRQAIDRKLNYQVYTQAEMSGMVKFNNGNPCPSWCYDRAETLTSALITVDEMQGKYKGVGDVKATVAQGSQE